MSTGAGDVAVIGAVVVAWCLFGHRAQRFGITAPIVFVLAGLILGGPRLLDLSPDTEGFKLVAEVTLALLLFSDAARVNLTSLRDDAALPIRLLAIGLPLTVIAGTVAAQLILPGLALTGALLIAACLAPTVAGLGVGIVTDERLPTRVRRALNVESGLNDGIITPVVSLAIAVLAGEAAAAADGFTLHALRELGLGAVIGVAVGVSGGWLLMQATRRRWAERGAVPVAVLALSISAYFAAVAVEGNGFLAAFGAGLCFGPFRAAIGDNALELGEDSSQLLALIVWFLFGAAMLRPTLSALTWAMVLYAVVSLTVVRMVPVAVSLIGMKFDATTVAVMGWFGPRGMASLIFALLAFDDLGPAAGPVVAVVSITVAFSVAAHGASASPIIARYHSVLKTTSTDAAVLRPVDLPRPRRGLVRPE